ncbi:MAG: hypothetical protein N3B21_19310 [Clostridia bacterium]|nr:hypothetical protein [Clostridia bacterium]
MKVSVKMNGAKLRQLSKDQIKAAKMTGEQMLHEIVTEAVIPFDTGQLQNVQTYVDDSKAKGGTISIVHDTPYAARLYFHPEYNFDTTVNANARGEWWDEWLNGSKKSRPRKLFKQFMRKLTGG